MEKGKKICFSSTGETIESDIDPRFGRCKYFVMVDIGGKEGLTVQAVKNVGKIKNRGAGVAAAEQVGRLEADVLVTGNIGPKSSGILRQLGIEIYKKSGVIKNVINEYLDNVDWPALAKNQAALNFQKERENPEVFHGKLLVPLLNNNGVNSEISPHFGHAPYFGLYDILSERLIIEPNGLDHHNPSSAPAQQIAEHVGPTIIFARQMGVKAIRLFKKNNILIKTGPHKILSEVIANLKNLENLDDGCGHFH